MQQRNDRILRSVGVALGVRSCVVYERRGREWALAVAYTSFVALAWLARDRLTTVPIQITTLIAAVLTAVWPFLMWRWLPWSARVVIDQDEDVCRVSYRFFAVPYRRYRIPLESRRFAYGRARIDYKKRVTEERSDSLGCVLGLLLGPILGYLVTPQATRAVRVSERRSGLVLRNVADGSLQLVVAVRDRDSVEEALITIAQVGMY